MIDQRTSTTMEMVAQLSAAGYGGCWAEPAANDDLEPALPAAARRKGRRQLISGYLLAGVVGALFWTALGGLARLLLGL